ncbi:GNAT family N-acetyltransferase [Amycolatopsis sacchari]|uniref:Protein N-acetyltransferase, RimJ/RimL family n=1 Tax=Amycolatopsis sacchari TaxID=115433 RepID=A0A1I3JU33_9PSEU|nr:GNAT family N-acetyltransferase [Amycolatopsis sacchari]SFI63694.1 Protein N-acetyltransferase, RimJ/RimL family [Amycolatopsis sacchari]
MTAVITEPTAPAVERLLLACSATSLSRRFFLPGRPDPRDVWRRYRRYLLAGHRALAWVDGAPAGLLNLVPTEPAVAELGLLVADPWQRQGVGSELAHWLWRSGCWAGRTVHATVQPDNAAARALLHKQGFTAVASFEQSEQEYSRLAPGTMTDVMEVVA